MKNIIRKQTNVIGFMYHIEKIRIENKYYTNKCK